MLRRKAKTILAASAAVLFATWIAAIVWYDPWRRRTVREAIGTGSRWYEAVIAAEGSAFPPGEEFGAHCMAGDGVAAQFLRSARTDYRILQYGQLEAGVFPSSRRLTSEEVFKDKESWRHAVHVLGQRLRCESLEILFPPTDVMSVALTDEGRVATNAVNRN